MWKIILLLCVVGCQAATKYVVGNITFSFHEESSDWETANMLCSSLGVGWSLLTSITTQISIETLKVLVDVIGTHNWVGVKFNEDEKEWKQGDVPSGECLAASTVLPYILKKPCTNSYPYICEYNPAQIVQNYTEWTSWSECVNSTQKRTQACTATVSGNCINTETQACNETTNTSTLSTTPINIISSLQTTGRHTTATDGRLDTSTVHASTTSRTTTDGYSLDASTKHASTTSHTTTDGYGLDALTTHASTTSHTTADGYSSDASTVHSSMTTHTITHSKIAQSKSKSVDVHSSNTPTGIATKAVTRNDAVAMLSKLVSFGQYPDQCPIYKLKNVNLSECYAKCSQEECKSFTFSATGDCIINWCVYEENLNGHPGGKERIVYFERV